MTTPAAIVFDLQGTLVDFHEPLMRLGRRLNGEKGIAVDWPVFSTRWRALYRQAMDDIIDGSRPWRRVDAIYRDALDTLLAQFEVADRFDGSERDDLNLIWTKLDAWPDSVDGLARLRTRYVTATLTNAAMAAAVAVVKHAALPFDAVLSAELAGSYKPSPSVYRLASAYLGFPPEAIMLVACHKYDLKAAAASGLKTGFVSRPLEFGPDGHPDADFDDAFDLNARDLSDLADQLGC